MEQEFDVLCPILFISRAISNGILDDRCKQERCALWNILQNRCGLIR